MGFSRFLSLEKKHRFPSPSLTYDSANATCTQAVWAHVSKKFKDCEIKDGEQLKKAIAESANFVRSGLVVYEMGCGLPILLPHAMNREGISGYSKLQLGELVFDSPDPSNYGSFRKISFDRAIARNLKDIWLVKVADWCNGKEVGLFTITNLNDTLDSGQLYFYASRTINLKEQKINFEYDVGISISPLEVFSLRIEYSNVASEAEIPKHQYKLKFSISADKRTQSSGEIKVSRGNTFRFDGYGRLSGYVIANGDLSNITKKQLSLILEAMKRDQSINLGEIAAMQILSMKAPHQKLDYSRTIINIIRAVTENSFVGLDKLLIFKD